jgi:hypothetical protein
MMNAIRSLQYVCLFQADFPTQSDGDVFLYLAVDAYSGFVFITGYEKQRSPELVVKHIKLLLENKDFISEYQKQKSFTLVLHKFEELRPAIEPIIQNMNGRMVVSDLMVTEIVLPVMEEMFKFLRKN